MPIIVPFYKSNGLDQFDIMLLQSVVYSLTIAVFEIPSGYLADLWGRKNTLITGAILGFSGFLTYCFSYELELFMVAEFILGIGQSLISGSDSAMLYDTLMEHKKSKEYAKYEGRLTAFGNFAESIAGVLGGSVLVLVSLRMPFYFQAGVAFLAIPAALTLYEPMRHKTLMRFSFKDILKIVKDSLVNNKKRKTTIIFSSFIGTCTLTMAWFVQPYFLFVDVPLPLFGVFWPLLNLLVGVVS
ncbi:MAG: MFS transporter, partial [Bacteroidota bacterium]